MGLDMGICVKRTPYTNSIKALQPFTMEWDREQKYDFDICYWRKCWNVYYDLENALCCYLDNDCRYHLGIEDLENILTLLEGYDEETWDENNTIWAWEQHKKINATHIENLKKLIGLMRTDPEIQPYLYISY